MTQSTPQSSYRLGTCLELIDGYLNEIRPVEMDANGTQRREGRRKRASHGELSPSFHSRSTTTSPRHNRSTRLTGDEDEAESLRTTSGWLAGLDGSSGSVIGKMIVRGHPSPVRRARASLPLALHPHPFCIHPLRIREKIDAFIQEAKKVDRSLSKSREVRDTKRNG